MSTEITVGTPEAVDREVRELLITARIGLLLKTSFFGNLATRLKLVNADSWCSTAATDGRNFYYNTDFVKNLRAGEREFLFGHEVLHCVYDHFGRKQDRDGKLWNIAGDFCINADLKKHNVGEFISTVDCLYDPKYDGWSAEQVYDDLMENAETIDVEELLEKLLDEHLNDGSSEGDGNGSGNRPHISEEERQQIRDSFREAVISAAQAANPGSLPAGVQRMVQELTDPKLNWRDLLRTSMQSTIKDDYTWNRMSRRSWHVDAVLPGHSYAETINIAIALDMSGSIQETQIRDFLSEVKGIIDSFPAFNLHVFSFDTDVYNYCQFTSENLESIESYECIGGGGTQFSCIFNFLKDSEIEPEQLIIFTDGQVCDWGDENYCDTIFVLHNNHGSIPEVPYGVGVEYT